MSNIKHLLFSNIIYYYILSSSLSVMGQITHHERQTSEEGDKTERKK